MSQRTFQRSLPSFTSIWSGTATWNGDTWPSGSCEHLSNQNRLASSGQSKEPVAHPDETSVLLATPTTTYRWQADLYAGCDWAFKRLRSVLIGQQIWGDRLAGASQVPICVIVIIHCVHFGKMIVFINIWSGCSSYSCFRTECLWKTVDKCVFRSLSFVFFSEKASGGTNSAWLWLHPLPKSQSCWGKKNSLSSSCKIGLILTSMKSRLVPVWPQHCWFLLLFFFLGKMVTKNVSLFSFLKKRQDLQKLST